MSDKPSQDGKDKREDESGGSSASNSPCDSRARLDSKKHRKKKSTKHDERASHKKPSVPKTHSSGRSIRNNHQSMDINALRQDHWTEERLKELENDKSKGKSASVDAMALQKKSADRLEAFANNNPFRATKESFMKGRLFRSNKVAPTSIPLEEVLTLSPVVVIPSACDGTRNPSCVHSQIVGDSGHRPEASVSNDSMENICRICHDSPTEEKLITPCLCKGSMAKVHRTCLERWLGESGKSACEICGQEYNTVRVPKYTGFRSFISWIRHPLTPTDSRNFFFDLACFFILTPLACLSAWLCVLGAKHYTIEEHRSALKAFLNDTQEARANRDASNSMWTSVGLLSLTGTLVAAYYIWIFVAVRYHLQVWKDWQRRNYIVTIVPLANGDFSHSPPPPPPPRERDSDDSDESSSSSSPVRIRGQPDADRNNNSNRNSARNNNPVSSQVRMNNNLLQRSYNPGEVSDTALFYQSVFGGDSDESLSEQAMIRLATLRSEYDAIGNVLPASVTIISTSELQKRSSNKLIPTANTVVIPDDHHDGENNSIGRPSTGKSLARGSFVLDADSQKGTTEMYKGSITEDTAISVRPNDVGKPGPRSTRDSDTNPSSKKRASSTVRSSESNESWETVSRSSTGDDDGNGAIRSSSRKDLLKNPHV